MSEQPEFSPKKILALTQKVNYLTSYYQNRIKLLERRLLELEAAVFRNDRDNSSSKTTDNVKCEPCEPPSTRRNLFSENTLNTVCEGNKNDYDRKEIFDTTLNKPSASTSKTSDTAMPDSETVSKHEDDIIELDTNTNILNAALAILESNVKRRASDPIDVHNNMNDSPGREILDTPNTGGTQTDVNVCAHVSNCVGNSSVTSNTARKKQKLDDCGEPNHNNNHCHQKDDNESPPTDLTVRGVDAHSVPVNPPDLEWLSVPLLFDSDGYAKVYIYLNYVPNRPNSNVAVAAWFNEKHPFNFTDVFCVVNKNVAAILLATRAIATFKEIYAPKFKKLCIYTCSEYLIKLDSELPRYEKNYFYKEDGKPVKYSREIIPLANIKKDLEIRVNFLDMKNIYDIGIKGILELVNSHQLI